MQSVDIGLAYWKWRRSLIAKRKQRFMAKYVQSDDVLRYVNCSLTLRMCNMWQFGHYLFVCFSLLFLFYLLFLITFYSFLVCCQLTW